MRQFPSAFFLPTMNKDCVSPVKFNLSLNGQLVLIPQNPGGYEFLSKMFSTRSIIYTLKSGQAVLIDEKSLTGRFAPSPDGKRLAYEKINTENGYEKRDLVIRSNPGGETRMELSDQQLLAYWLNNSNIMLSKQEQDKLPVNTILNVSTMKADTIAAGSENLITTDTYKFWHNIWPTVEFYSPEMTRTLYLAEDAQKKDHPINPSFFSDLVLFDTKMNLTTGQF
jgi:hypothetical protein